MRLSILLLTFLAMAAAAWARHAGGDDVTVVNTVDVVASRFEFTPAVISVRQGDTVRLRLRSADRSHAFALKAYGVKAVVPSGGDPITVEFVADQAGAFEFDCAEYCGAGHSRMKGRLIVLSGKR